MTKPPFLILAPMAGYTDLAFRTICQKNGADITYSEMISAHGLAHGGKKSLELLENCGNENLFVQLFGSDPQQFSKAAKIINALPEKKIIGGGPKPLRPRGIDINFGCPVKKVIKQQSGCFLMKKPLLAKDIIRAVLDKTNLPVSIKIRSGIGEHDALKFLETVGALDWKTVIIHGRSFEQGFSGPIDLELIQKIKKEFPKKTIVANGGISDPETAMKVWEKTRCDGLAIGRGALGAPWIFSQIKNYFQKKSYSAPTFEQIKKAVQKHFSTAQKLQPDKNFFELRCHLALYFKNLSGAKKIRESIFSTQNFTELSALIKSL